MATATISSITLPVENGQHIDGDLNVPEGAIGLVVFAHGSGSSRHSARNIAVAVTLQGRHLGTLLADLLTSQEESVDTFTAEYRFDIPRLGRRVVAMIDWIRGQPQLARLPVGCFGASTGAAAALIAAAERPAVVQAVVSRGGRPDLANAALPRVTAPTLLIVGGNDEPVIDMNQDAMSRMRAGARVELAIVPGASHLFEEPGTLQEVERLTGDWFVHDLPGRNAVAD